MRKWKSVVIYSLFAALLVAMIGCAKSNNTPANDTGSKTSAPSAETPASSEPAETDSEPTYDLKGRTITISHWADIEPKGDTEAGEKVLKRWQAVEKKYNVKLKGLNIPYEEYKDKFMASVLAGKPMADMSYMDMAVIVTAAKGGLLQDLTDLVNKDYWVPEMVNWAGYKGALYGMSLPVDSGRGIYYNKTLFTNAGLEDPGELAERNEWTWDKFLEMAKALTKDLDGDGKIDQYGYHGIHYMIGQDLIASNKAEIVTIQDDKYVSAWDSPGTMEALRFLYDLINVHKVLAPFPVEERMDAFTSGKVAMKQSAPWEAGQFKTVLGDNFSFVPTPRGPQADKFYSPDSGTQSVVIPKGVENPEVLVKIFEDLSPPKEEWGEGTRSYLEDTQPSERDVNMIMSLQDGLILARETMDQPIFAEFVDAINDIFYAGVTAEVAVEKRKQTIQTAIDAFFNS